ASAAAGYPVWPLPAPGTAVGRRLGAVPLRVAAGSAGIALQVWRRSGRGQRAFVAVAACTATHGYARVDRARAAARRSPACSGLQPVDRARQDGVEPPQRASAPRCTDTPARNAGANRAGRPGA